MKSSSSVVILISLNDSIHIKIQTKPNEPKVKNIQRQFKCGQIYIYLDKYRKALNPSAAPQASFKLKCMHLTPYFSSKLL